ncbi:MAG: hypothetical protein R2690_17815 [Acidimicrobiales bacterium]
MTMPTFSCAIAWRQPGRKSVWSGPMLVMTATAASATLVASNRPRTPTSTTATSTGSSANQANADAVSTSKYDGVTPATSATAATSPMMRPSSSSSIRPPVQRNRSLRTCRWGLA